MRLAWNKEAQSALDRPSPLVCSETLHADWPAPCRTSCIGNTSKTCRFSTSHLSLPLFTEINGDNRRSAWTADFDVLEYVTRPSRWTLGFLVIVVYSVRTIYPCSRLLLCQQPDCEADTLSILPFTICQLPL